ncbi:Hypothetical predicted protein [Podarcis lilfordi]|uniref:Uncharacterized protein n=1 Tax=Podarcis lilfordi TaxID=74358 RepID=A0AA35PMV8_9SAUR|nr:Hypothetical predicted protein [Podarcis lilfordi]
MSARVGPIFLLHFQCGYCCCYRYREQPKKGLQIALKLIGLWSTPGKGKPIRKSGSRTMGMPAPPVPSFWEELDSISSVRTVGKGLGERRNSELMAVSTGRTDPMPVLSVGKDSPARRA